MARIFQSLHRADTSTTVKGTTIVQSFSSAGQDAFDHNAGDVALGRLLQGALRLWSEKQIQLFGAKPWRHQGSGEEQIISSVAIRLIYPLCAIARPNWAICPSTNGTAPFVLNFGWIAPLLLSKPLELCCCAPIGARSPGWTGPMHRTIDRTDHSGPRARSRSEELGKEAVREQIGRVVGGKCLDLPRPRRIGCTPGRIGVTDLLQYCWIAPGAAAWCVCPAF